MEKSFAPNTFLRNDLDENVFDESASCHSRKEKRQDMLEIKKAAKLNSNEITWKSYFLSQQAYIFFSFASIGDRCPCMA